MNLYTILNLDCSDLTWISKTNYFNDLKIKYTGIDVVEFLIDDHIKKYPTSCILL